jgi:hypothetical protein
MTSLSVRADSDGDFPVEFSVRDVADVAADESDVWIRICDRCSFAKMPEGFDEVPGEGEHERHLHLALLNPGAAVKMRANIKVSDGIPALAGFTVFT